MNSIQFTALVATTLIAFSTRASEPVASAGTNRTSSCCLTNTVHRPDSLPDKSLFHLNSQWIDDAGKTNKLASLKGKVQVVTVFFSKCEFTCPVLVNDLRRIEAALPEAIRGEVGFVLVSLDTERDTPEVLHSYREKAGLDSAHWSLWRGEADDVQELCLLLGVKFKKDARGQFAHSNLISVLNATGEIIHQQAGINQDPKTTLDAISRAIK